MKTPATNWVREADIKLNEGLSININGQEYQIGIASFDYDNYTGIIDLHLRGWPDDS